MKKGLTLSTLSGLILGAIMMNIAWKHNAQGEIYTNKTVDFSYWLLIGFSWFVFGFIVVFLLVKIINYLKKGLK
jgi:hypothetical protein